MKTTTITKLVTLSLLTATMLHATNGDALIGVGAKARAMGGTAVALGHGAEGGFANPATITQVEGTEISFGGTLFLPDIETGFGAGGVVFDSDKSHADTNIIPSVSIASKINENWFIGAGMWGTAGMGTDFRNAGSTNQMDPSNGLMKMVTNLQLLSFGVPIAYKTSGFSIGVTPLLQYGNLDINYDGQMVVGYDGQTGMPNAFMPVSTSQGLSQDFGFGWQAGMTYDFGEMGVEGLTLGLNYKSSIEMTYDGQITSAMKPFLAFGDFATEIGDTLEQPEEFSAGIAYVTGAHSFAFDYKNIKWSEAVGYADFGWDDSDVYAFGYQFEQEGWALRLGYNYASSAIVENNDARLNYFNLLGFPATQEHHYTFGGTYELSEMFSADLAYVYAPSSETTFDISGLGQPMSEIANTHSEDSLTFQFNFKF